MDTKTTIDNRVPFNYGWVAAISGFFMHLCLGTMYCWGALTPYITSYLRKYDPSLTYRDTVIVFLLCPAAQTIGMPIGGAIERRYGPRVTALVGVWFMSFGVFISYYATSLLQLVSTYGFMYGIGMGIAYMNPIQCGMRWMPKRKGIISGIVVTGFGLGGAMFNVIGSKVCNPDNIASDPYYGPEVADQVPKMFMILGTLYAIITTLASLALVDPTPEDLARLNPDRELNQALLKAKAADNDDGETDLCGMLQTSTGYILWAMLAMSCCSGILVISSYKTFAQTHGYSDGFLTIMGSFALIINGLGRMAYGVLIDTFGYKSSLLMENLLQVVFTTSFLFSVSNPILYTFVVCGMITNYGGNFAMFPTVTAELFGTKNVGSNYGFIFSGFAVSGISLKLALGSPQLSFETVVYGCGVLAGISALCTTLLPSPPNAVKEHRV